LSKIEGLPFLNDLVRVETFNTDLTYGELRKRKMMLIPVVVSYHVRGIQLTFKFTAKKLQQAGEEFVIHEHKQGNYIIEMMPV